MAETNAIRVYLREVIGLGLDAAGLEKANAIIAQGLDSFSTLTEMEKDDIKTLCSTARRPGGLVVDPNDNTRQVPDPGVAIPALCETRLGIAAYGAKIYSSIGRNLNGDTLSRNRLNHFRRHKETIENNADPDSLPALSKSFGIMKLLEHFPTYLESKLGTTNVPLAYVIRENEGVPAALPGQAHGRPWSVGHDSLIDELIRFTPHVGASFRDDNGTVFRLLQEVLAGTQHMSSIKPFQARRDGRGAFEALKLHNMGNSKWEKVCEVAEALVTQRVWDGRNSRFPLKSHIAKHREAHNDFL